MKFDLLKRTPEFFDYAVKRQMIKLAKEKGLSPPWIQDPILQNYRFCNVFREDDKVTQWFRTNIRDPLKDDPTVLLATFAFRIFNLPDSGQTMLDAGGLSVFTTIGWQKNRERIRKAINKQEQKVTGAYMTKTPTGMNKTDGTMWIIDQFIDGCEKDYKSVENVAHLMDIKKWSLETATKWLAEFPFMGPFLAYEVVTDLYHTSLLEKAPDIMTWANPGPGAARGLARMCGLDPTALKRQRPDDVKIMMELMQKLLMYSREMWPNEPAFPDWDMRTVEHTLCEFDKYERVRLGEGTPKSRYNGRGDKK